MFDGTSQSPGRVSAGGDPPHPLVFLDTETTGLHRGRRPWEIAIIRRDGDGQSRLLLCVDINDLDLSSADPIGLKISGFHKRHPQARLRPRYFPRVYRASEAATIVQQWTAGATIVRVVPRFDTECLADMLARHHLEPAWQPNLVDVTALAKAAVKASGRQPEPHFTTLSRQCGVKPPTPTQRHTALADARWAMRWYDKLAEF
jgi:DNA polymerase III epsilon subunit-like protein